MVRFPLTLTLLFSATLVLAQSAPKPKKTAAKPASAVRTTPSTAASLNSPIPLDPAVKVGKLPNGLTYYIRKNAEPKNRAELRLVIRAGSVLENDNQQGLAHFMEHMEFNGTKNFPKNELVNFLQ